jgi:hypothetical protein
MSKKLQMGLASVLAVAACAAAPAMAQATPKWFSNFALVGTNKQDVIVFGTLTMKNKEFGAEWKCKIVAGILISNEGGKGLASWEGWAPYLCSASSTTGTCKSGQSYVVAEYPIKLEEKENIKKEIEYEAKRPNPSKTTPWPAELETQATTGKTTLNSHKLHWIVNCPAELFEVNFEGNIEPHVINGSGSGLAPTHLIFEGEGGTTSWLNGTWFGGKETETTKLYVSGELTMIGNQEQLIQAE